MADPGKRQHQSCSAQGCGGISALQMSAVGHQAGRGQRRDRRSSRGHVRVWLGISAGRTDGSRVLIQRCDLKHLRDHTEQK